MNVSTPTLRLHLIIILTGITYTDIVQYYYLTEITMIVQIR